MKTLILRFLMIILTLQPLLIIAKQRSKPKSPTLVAIPQPVNGGVHSTKANVANQSSKKTIQSSVDHQSKAKSGSSSVPVAQLVQTAEPQKPNIQAVGKQLRGNHVRFADPLCNYVEPTNVNQQQPQSDPAKANPTNKPSTQVKNVPKQVAARNVVQQPVPLPAQSVATQDPQQGPAVQNQQASGSHPIMVQEKPAWEKKYEAQLQEGIKQVAFVWPLSTAVATTQMLVGTWAFSAGLNKITGWGTWPFLGTLPSYIPKIGGMKIGGAQQMSSFTMPSFSESVLHAFPAAFTSGMVSGALDWAAYKAMEAAGLERYALSSWVAALVHKGGYDKYVKDQKVLNKRAHRFTMLDKKINKKMIARVQKDLQGLREKEFSQATNLTDEQFMQRIENMPEEAQKMLLAQAFSTLTPQEQQQLDSPEVESKVKKTIIGLIKAQMLAPVSLEEASSFLAQLKPEQQQALKQEIIKELSEKQKKFLARVRNPHYGAAKRERLEITSNVQGLVGTLKSMFFVGPVITASIAAVILKSVFGWVTPTIVHKPKITQPVVNITGRHIGIAACVGLGLFGFLKLCAYGGAYSVAKGLEEIGIPARDNRMHAAPVAAAQ